MIRVRAARQVHLVAAAHQSGLGVLGDESVLAARSDPDELISGVRDITLLPEARGILGVDDADDARRRDRRQTQG